MCQEFVREFLQYMEDRQAQVAQNILETRELTAENQAVLRQALADFKANFTAKVGAA